jgi:hypothetical protein
MTESKEEKPSFESYPVNFTEIGPSIKEINGKTKIKLLLGLAILGFIGVIAFLIFLYKVVFKK